MIKIDKINSKYVVRFDGKKDQFNKYINRIMKVEEKEYDFELAAWTFDEEGINKIRELFSFSPTAQILPSPSSVVVDDDIGSTMKLQPYPYQKEAIQYILDNKEALLILPCGAGKTPTMVGAYLELKERGLVTGPGLIVVKASLKYQWHKEVSKFSDLTSIVVLTS